MRGPPVAVSLGTVIQLEAVGAANVLDMLGVISCQAARHAIRQATAAEIHALREAGSELADFGGGDAVARSVRGFYNALGQAAHHPLIEAISAFLADVQAEFALMVTDSAVDATRAMLVAVQPLRMRFVDAIERRDEKAALALAHEFHQESARRLASLPNARSARIGGPQLGSLLSAVVADLSQRP